MNTKAGLGVSPIISVSYSVSTIWGHNFGNTTLLLYSVFVLAEMILHSLLAYRGKKRGAFCPKTFHRASHGRDAVPSQLDLHPVSQCVWSTDPRLGVRLCGNLLGNSSRTGSLPAHRHCADRVGAALSLNMRLIPNPGDGIVQTLSDFSGGSVGLTKNCFDIGNVLLTSTIGLLMAGQLVGIGLGTILSMICCPSLLPCFVPWQRWK